MNHTPPAAQPHPGGSLTEEQQAAIAIDSASLCVNAFAGTGKTTTLVAFAQVRPNQRILYIAFNKAVQLEAARRFPPHVVAKTCHALAYRAEGQPYRHKLVSKLRPQDVIEPLGLAHYSLQEAYPLAFEVLTTLHRFLTSNAAEITPAMVSELYREDKGDWVVTQTNRLWRLMCDPNSSIGMVHDGYLKRYQLTQPRLTGFDIVLFDEAQDANPTMLDIVLHQDIPQVFVGDRHQQIYAWRGAQNAMELIQPSASAYLTQSFRFGPPIAGIANVLLSTYKAETIPVVGRRTCGRIGSIQRAKPYTIIARTNAGVFFEAAELVQRRRPPRLHFIGGVHSYPFQRILDAWYLYADLREQMRDPFLLSFADFTTMERLAEELDDLELKQLCRVVHRYGAQIPKLVHRITTHAIGELEHAQVCLSTGHKAKGLEFNQVKLAEDFPDLTQIPPAKLNPEEVNVQYVAATRAVEVLQINKTLRALPAIRRMLSA